MEQGPEQIKVASVSHEAFHEFINDLDKINGKTPRHDLHGFYLWLDQANPEMATVDGYSLLQVYEKNVIENSMTNDRFTKYCFDNDVPNPGYEGLPDTYRNVLGREFDEWKAAREAGKMERYIVWAEDNDIRHTAGAQMLFISKAGVKFRSGTGPDNLGEFLGHE